MKHSKSSFNRAHPDPPIRVRGPASLAAALPYLIDVPLAGRVVLALVGAQNMLTAAAHAPIDPFPTGASDELRLQWAGDVATLVADGLALFDHGSGERAAVAVFLPAGAELCDPELSRRLRELAPVLGGRLLDMIAVRNGRWRSLLCENDECCPAQGVAILDNSDAVRVSAELIGAGVLAEPLGLPDRADSGEVRAELQAMPYPRTVKARRELLRQVWPLIALPPPALAALETARLAMAADRPGVRDAILVRMARFGESDSSRWEAQRQLWLQVSGSVPPQWRAGAACMLAITDWARRDLVGTRTALEMALQAEPEHRMAGLIRRLLTGGIPASNWFAQMAGISEAQCLRFDRPPRHDEMPHRSAG